jgi:hypothetical protein
MAENESEKKTYHEVSGLNKLLVWILHKFIFIIFLTYRIHYTEEDEKIMQNAEGKILAFWHNRLMAVPVIVKCFFKKKIRIAAYVSSSKDGAFLVELLRYYNVAAVRGSTNKRSLEGTRDAVKYLKQGYSIGITPDGPQGPMYELKPGAAMLAKLSHAPVILFGLEYSNAWRFNKAWDQFFLPKPFSRIDVKVKVLEALPKGDYSALAHHLQEELMAITEQK